MLLRRAVRVPWSVLGAVTALSIVVVSLPVKAFGLAFDTPKSRGRHKRGARSRTMPEVYDAQEVVVMLRMVQAAMQHKSQELDKERSSALQLRQELDDLQENLENANYLFAQVCCVLSVLPGDRSAVLKESSLSVCMCRNSNTGWGCRLNWRQQRLQLQIYVRCSHCFLVIHLPPALTLYQTPAGIHALHLIKRHHGD